MVNADSSNRPGAVQIVPSRSCVGDCQFTVLVKRSYDIIAGKPAQRCDADAPLQLTDAYYDRGDPEWSVVEHENDMAPFKAATDVVIVGKAHAPNRQPTSSMVVGVKVGEHKKLLRIMGDRVCHWRADDVPVFSEPLPFTEMEIRYDRAYGGRDEKSDGNLPFFYPRNDMGRGVALRNGREVIEGLALPNIEDPDDLLAPERVVIEDPARWPLQPLPQGLGWRQRTWYPRCALMGALPAFLQPGVVTAEEALNMLPQNHVALARQMRLPPFEAQFHNGASLGLALPEVNPGEAVGLRGLTPDGSLDFKLPMDTPLIGLDTGHGATALPVRMHTVSIRPDALAMDIVWGGLLIYGPYSKLPQLRNLQAVVQ